MTIILLDRLFSTLIIFRNKWILIIIKKKNTSIYYLNYGSRSRKLDGYIDDSFEFESDDKSCCIQQLILSCELYRFLVQIECICIHLFFSVTSWTKFKIPCTDVCMCHILLCLGLLRNCVCSVTTGIILHVYYTSYDQKLSLNKSNRCFSSNLIADN